MSSRSPLPAGRARPTRPSHRRFAVGAGVLLTLVVLHVHTGFLTSGPLRRAGLIWPVYVGVVLVGAVLSARARTWRSAIVWAFLLTWAVLWAWMPYAIRVAPDARAAGREVLALGYSVAISTAALLLGLRAGMHWWRVGWAVGLAFVTPVAVWELTTHHHFDTGGGPFPYPEPVAVVTFQNPNNFGIVLLSMVVALTAWAAATSRRSVRVATTVAALVAAVLVLASESRAALLGLVLLAVVEVRRRMRAHPGAVRAFVARRRRLVGAVSAVAGVAVLATFVVPALARHNPVYRLLYAAIQPTTATSDLARLRLMQIALRQWVDSGFLGTGAGAFEPLLWNDPTSPFTVKLNLHNAFVEVLSQYGVVVAVPFAALMALLVRLAWRTRLSATMRPRVALARAEMIGHLIVFVALGCTASSALTLPVWWLMLACTCTSAAWLSTLTRPDRGRAAGLHPRGQEGLRAPAHIERA